MKTFCISYNHGGHEYGLEVVADSSEDAQARLRSIGYNGRVDGELMAKIPAVAGPLVPLFVTIRNWLFNRQQAV